MNLLQNLTSGVRGKIYVSGRNTTVGTTVEELYNYSLTMDWLTQMGTPSTVAISSGSTADTLAGTGAQKVRIIGCNAVGAIVSEDVNMNGQTAVNTTAVFKVVLGHEVIKVGTGKVNAGILYIVKTGTGGTYASGVPGTTTSAFGQLPAGWMEAMNGIYVVPEGKTARVSAVYGISRTQAATVLLTSEPLSGAGPLITHAIPLELGATSPEGKMRGINTSYNFPEKTLIRLRAIGAAASASVIATMEITLK